MAVVRRAEDVALERAQSDCHYHYNVILSHYEEQAYSKELESRNDLNKLKKWLLEYISWARKWHLNNFKFADDLYVDPECREALGDGLPPPHAPKMKIFSELN